ncbi:MAG: S49 family peptidase [Dolichospermum sp.]
MQNLSNIVIDQSQEAQLTMLVWHAISGTSPQIRNTVQVPQNFSDPNSSTTENTKKVAVIPISGILQLENEFNFWGDIITYGTRKIARNIEDATNDPDVVGIIITGNSGGGDSTASGVVIDAIEEFKATGRKVIGAIESLAGSLCLEILMSCDAIYATNESAMVGCIGSQCTIVDYSHIQKLMGIKTTTIKSDLTPEKNIEVEQALNGKPKLILERWINPSAQIFIDRVLASRPNVSPIALKGGTYLAQKALELGLIDGIMNVKNIVASIFGNKEISKSNPTISNQSEEEDMNLSLVKLGVLCSTLNIQLKNEAGEDLTGDQLLENIASQIPTLQAEAGKVVQLEAQITQLTTEKSTLQSSLDAANAKTVELQAQIAKLPGAARSEARVEKPEGTPPTSTTSTENITVEGEDELKASFGLS